MQFSFELLTFLKQLERNNNRDWFNTQKPHYKVLNTQAKQVVNYIGELMQQHDVIDATKVFRIYRDVRFSKNKLPYKTHFSASYHRKKPELRGGFYVHIQPNNKSFIATGFWDPNKEDLLRIRKEFEIDATEMEAILKTPSFAGTWGNLQGDELKTAPRGFNKTHPNINFIKKKQFIFTKPFTDKAVLQPNFPETVNQAFKAARPFLNYFSAVLTTNLNGESLI